MRWAQLPVFNRGLHDPRETVRTVRSKQGIGRRLPFVDTHDATLCCLVSSSCAGSPGAALEETESHGRKAAYSGSSAETGQRRSTQVLPTRIYPEQVHALSFSVVSSVPETWRNGQLGTPSTGRAAPSEVSTRDSQLAI